jgi:hypothetical protein
MPWRALRIVSGVFRSLFLTVRLQTKECRQVRAVTILISAPDVSLPK